jgi:mono/diheme cytochrome c family protein
MKPGRAILLGAFFGAAALAGCDNMQDQPGARAADQSWPRPIHSVARGAPEEAAAARRREPSTRAVLERGRERFNIYCAVCHGEDGYGTGIVVRRGFPPPPSFHDDRLRTATDDHLFEVMTRGFGVMLPYADRIVPRDRWAIVAYVRALQRSQHATLADVPAEARGKFSAP